MKHFIFIIYFICSSLNIFSQQSVITKEDMMLKQIALKYIELTVTQLNTKKKNPCDMVSTLDIKQSILNCLDAVSRINESKIREELIAIIKANPIIKPLLNSEFSLKLAYENIKSESNIWSYFDNEIVHNAFKNTIFWGPAPGVYGHISYYKFNDKTTEFHYCEDPEKNVWKMQIKNYKIIIRDNSIVYLEIGENKYILFRYEGNNQPFILKPIVEEYNDTFHETASECES